MSKQQDRMDSIIKQAKELRSLKEAAEHRFLMFLVRIEKDEQALLSSCGFESFAQFLKSNELCDVARYENFKAGLVVVGEKKAEELGANPVVAAARVVDRKKIPEFVQAVASFTKVHGVAPSLQASQRMLRQVDPRPEVPRDVSRLSEIERLRQENAQLKTQVARLTRENEKLKKDLAKKAA